MKSPSPLAPVPRRARTAWFPGNRGWVGWCSNLIALDCPTPILALILFKSVQLRCCLSVILSPACFSTHMWFYVYVLMSLYLRVCHYVSIKDAYMWICVHFCVLCLYNCLGDVGEKSEPFFAISTSNLPLVMVNSLLYGSPQGWNIPVWVSISDELPERMRRKNLMVKGISILMCFVLFFSNFCLPICISHLVFPFLRTVET